MVGQSVAYGVDSDSSPRTLCLCLAPGAGLEQGYAAKITSYTNYDTNYLYWCALVGVPLLTETCHDFGRHMQPAVVTVPLVTNGHCTTAHSLKDPSTLTGTAKP